MVKHTSILEDTFAGCEQESASPDMNFWRDFLASKELIHNLDKVDFNNLTPIQAAAVPKVARGLDSLVISGRGTGKTTACLIPLLDYVVVILLPFTLLRAHMHNLGTKQHMLLTCTCIMFRGHHGK